MSEVILFYGDSNEDIDIFDLHIWPLSQFMSYLMVDGGTSFGALVQMLTLTF